MTGNVCSGVTVIGSAVVEDAHARHACETRPAVHLGRARAAVAGLAVPAHGHVRRLRGLDPVQDVEDDLAVLVRRRRTRRSHRRDRRRARRASSRRVGDVALRLRTTRRGRAVEVSSCRRLLDDLAQVVGHLRQRFAADLDAGAVPARRDVDLRELALVRFRVVIARVAAAALLAFERVARAALGDGQHGVEVDRHVPARVVRRGPR